MNRLEQLKMLDDILKCVDNVECKEKIQTAFYNHFLKNNNFNFIEIEYMDKKKLSKKEFSKIYDVEKSIGYGDICDEFGYEE